jgi:hypothetical protein
MVPAENIVGSQVCPGRCGQIGLAEFPGFSSALCWRLGLSCARLQRKVRIVLIHFNHFNAYYAVVLVDKHFTRRGVVGPVAPPMDIVIDIFAPLGRLKRLARIRIRLYFAAIPIFAQGALVRRRIVHLELYVFVFVHEINALIGAHFGRIFG